jgi:hypothetical protein
VIRGALAEDYEICTVCPPCHKRFGQSDRHVPLAEVLALAPANAGLAQPHAAVGDREHWALLGILGLLLTRYAAADNQG